MRMLFSAPQRFLFAGVFLLALLWGAVSCEPADGPTALSQVYPERIAQGESSRIELAGSGFDPALSRNLDCSGHAVSVDTDFTVRLRRTDSSAEWIALTKVEWLDFDALAATVVQSTADPLPRGSYDVLVETPGGRQVVLIAGLAVVGPDEMIDTETVDTETVDTETVDTETVDTETVDTETVDTETVDTETVDTETVDTETVDTMSPDSDTWHYTDTEDRKSGV